MERFSVSKINAYKQCKKLYKLKYIDKIETEQKPFALEKGDLIHRIIEQILITNNTQIDINNFKYDKNILSQNDIDDCLSIIKKFNMSNMYSVIKSLPFKKYVENKFYLDSNLNPSESQNSLFTGKIDLYIIDKNKNIGLNIDWKTGGKSADKYPLDPLQLNTYSLWLIQKYSLLGVKSKYYYVEIDKTIDSIFLKNSVDMFKSELKLLIDEILNCSNFLPSLSPLCNYCQYSEICA